jgi:hypothetical protein
VALYPWGGWLPLFALLRWRRPEARLLTALTLIPQTVFPYEMVALALIPRTKGEHLTLIGCVTVFSTAVFLIGPPMLTMHDDGARWVRAAQNVSVPLAVWLVYVPALVMVLRRPNTG